LHKKILKREIITTDDGSTSIHLIDCNENYHSKHGAIQEAKHVFIKNGLALFENKNISILEMGFGTGLNAFITFLEAEKLNQTINYIGVEAYPISESELQAMNFVEELNAQNFVADFHKMHSCAWEKPTQISNSFSLTKRQQLFENISDSNTFDLIYFDAFGYRVHSEAWSTKIFKKMYDSLKPNGVLVTYAARGVVKRSMIEVGFTVEKLDGPPGKREMFRATKHAANS
jgi:tRNA U34 5-methylaminomethyl-2-thiouridine-forming methyltransferase MnmC